MIRFLQARDRANEYITAHPREVRLLCFFAVFALVWMKADSIESFTHGLFDGIFDARQR